MVGMARAGRPIAEGDGVLIRARVVRWLGDGVWLVRQSVGGGAGWKLTAADESAIAGLDPDQKAAPAR
jgi:hypothetical protein